MTRIAKGYKFAGINFSEKAQSTISEVKATSSIRRRELPEMRAIAAPMMVKKGILSSKTITGERVRRGIAKDGDEVPLLHRIAYETNTNKLTDINKEKVESGLCNPIAGNNELRSNPTNINKTILRPAERSIVT